MLCWGRVIPFTGINSLVSPRMVNPVDIEFYRHKINDEICWSYFHSSHLRFDLRFNAPTHMHFKHNVNPQARESTRRFIFSPLSLRGVTFFLLLSQRQMFSVIFQPPGLDAGFFFILTSPTLHSYPTPVVPRDISFFLQKKKLTLR